MIVVMDMVALLGKRIIVIADSFEQKLPIGEYGYVIGQIRDTDNAFDYVVRIPKVNRQFFVAKHDIELEESYIQQLAQKAERDALINYALKTKNEALFNELTGVTPETHSKNQTQLGNDEFVRKIRLNSYI
jgi:hypothetical protein